MVVEQKREKSVVYVLGAGATKAVNSRAPLMADLLPEALRLFEQRLQQPQAPGADRACRIKAFIDDFYQLRRDKLPRLEDVLTQLDLAIEEGRPLSKHYNISYLRNLREDLVYALCEVLRETLSREEGTCMELTWKFLSTLGPEDSILSLNYDIIVDRAMSRQTGPVDYGLAVRYALKKKEAQPYRLGMPQAGPLTRLCWRMTEILEWYNTRKSHQREPA